MTPEAARDRRVARRLRWGLPILPSACFIALSIVWVGRIYSNQEQARENQIAACERGNVIRRHIALLEGITSVRLPDDLELIEVFPCDTLR